MQDHERIPVQYLRRVLFLELELGRLTGVIKARQKRSPRKGKRLSVRSRKKAKKQQRS
jgi:hypothetical protein